MVIQPQTLCYSNEKLANAPTLPKWVPTGGCHAVQS